MIKRIVFPIIAMLFFADCSEKKDVKIACIGDSITEGAGIYWQSISSYPVQLDRILGPGYTVLNCGRSGANMLNSSLIAFIRMKRVLR